MTSYLILVSPGTKNKEAVIWLFRTLLKALNIKQAEAGEKEKIDFETITYKDNSQLSKKDIRPETFKKAALRFSNEGLILDETGNEDELLTAFYLVNSLQEYEADNQDAIGRYKYENSYQQRFQKIEVNFVAELFQRYVSRNFPQLLNNQVQEKSRFFFSHDIDSLYGAFLQDGLAAVKKGRVDLIARLIMNAVLQRPEWFNIDKILKLESEYQLHSTFFWIVNKGRVNKALTNADYEIRSPRLQKTLKEVQSGGSRIGLHKSVSDESFAEEIHKLGQPVTINRNHYLRFQLPAHYDKVETSPLKVDCSLGFAEHYGFRNSLAIPFVPFDLATQQPYHFLEVPLNIMDGTFQKYMQLSPEESSRRMIEFIEKNKFNSVLSVLWHNHFFSSYRFRGFFEPYKELLIYLKEQKFSFIDPEQLYASYYTYEQVS